MKRFYLRWGVVLIVGIVIGLLGVRRYNDEVTAISPEAFLSERPAETVRVIGRVEAGSLVKEGSQTTFLLSGKSEKVPVRYIGEDSESLRELKTLVIQGRWNAADRELEAQKISLTPNYGFVAAAYLITLVPLGLFLFHMERKVALLYIMIKQEKPYQPEEQL